MPVKPVMPVTKIDLMNECGTVMFARNYFTEQEVNTMLDSWAALQTGERDERIKELEAGLRKIKDLQDEWEGTPPALIEVCTKTYEIATKLLTK